MQRFLSGLMLILCIAPTARATGLLIPEEKKLPPLAMVNHQVVVEIQEQVAITKIEQTFRNHTDRNLEATYIFPIPKGASVRKFSMWVDGKEVAGEMVEADKARKIYTEIVARTMDPGLLEYMGNNLLKLRVFPILPKSDQKIALSYTSISPMEQGLIEYTYPLKSESKAVATLEKFSLKVNLKSQYSLQNIYSPTHGITTSRPNDKEAMVGFEKDQATLDKDFQLFYATGTKDVGLTMLNHRPSAGQNGYFMMLVSPRAELSKTQQVPRDMFFVLDTSGSMRGKRLTQAKNALKYCLSNLGEKDRFAMLNFSTTVNYYKTNMENAGKEEIESAKKWVDGLECTGGTAINDALAAALKMRTEDANRTFTMVFFTDGRPTVGETVPEKILQNVAKLNSSNTRIFTFGVGDDVNASMLDALADTTRAVATYVRETEDIEAKVSGLYSKISNPVLANLKLTVGNGISLNEVYPPQLPDLFHGTQLVVIGRYTGKGHVAVKLTGNVGSDTKEFVYETDFPEKTGEEKNFVEDLWARRKVGYLLDQIRVNGEKKELLEEVVTLAKRYGITTPYTSYLVVPDGPVPVVRAPMGTGGPGVFEAPQLLQRGEGKGAFKLEDFAKDLPKAAAPNSPGTVITAGEAGGIAGLRNKVQAEEERKADAKTGPPMAKEAQKAFNEAREQKAAFDKARDFFGKKQLEQVQGGQLGVDLSVQTNYLRNQNRLLRCGSRNVQNRNVIEVGGVWIDDGFDPKMSTVTVKAMSKAYFRILEKHPAVREVFQLGNYVIWVAPNGNALIIDQGAGQEELADADIDRLFVPPMKK